jgi:hypothetical protein
MNFGRFVAIDWSGAKDAGRGLAGIQIAVCEAGRSAPRLVANPDGGNWRRSDVVSWLSDDVAQGNAALVGFDFAFSFPFCDSGRYFPNTEVSSKSPQTLWQLVDSVCIDAAEFYGRPFTTDHRVSTSFWSCGPRPAGILERHRETETVCARRKLGRPESIFKLLGPKQVGLGSLAGMRVLRRLHQIDGITIWPFDAAASGMTVVEIFPRRFLNEAGHGTAKIRTRAELDAALIAYGSEPAEAISGQLGDDQTDALVSAAALRHVADRREVWNPPSMTRCAQEHEGWIFGVV